MHPFLQTGDVLQLVVEYIGFAPSRYYFAACSHYLHREVHGEVYLSEADFFEALDRRLVNPKFLKLQVSALSDSLISRLSSTYSIRMSWSVTLESLVQNISMDELMKLGVKSLQKVLECSILRMNVPLFNYALKCIEAREYSSSLILEVLRKNNVQTALMTADALELLKGMVRHIPLLRETLLAEDLIVSAVALRATRCSYYLLVSCMGLKIPDRVLEAVASAGDLESVQDLCQNASPAMIKGALREAVIMRHLEIAAFLRCEWIVRQGGLSNDERIRLIEELLHAFYGKKSNRLLPDERTEEFLNWVFDGVDDLNNSRIEGMTLLEYACEHRLRKLCHYLVDRGCTSFSLQSGYDGGRIELTLEKQDLLHVLDLRCGVKNCVILEEDPAMELFLRTRGVRLCSDGDDVGFVREVLGGGLTTSSFANRVDLIKHYLMEDPESATQFCGFPSSTINCEYMGMTPLGALELLGTPQKRIWDGKNVIGFADFVFSDTKRICSTDEWNLTRPNEVEIQALRDIRAALLQHGADPEVLFDSSALHDLIWKRGGIVSHQFVKRVIDGRADVNDMDWSDQRPLRNALKTFQPTEVIKVLLDAGASIEPNTSLVGIDHFLKAEQLVAHNNLWAALSTFAVIRNPDILRLILDRKADPNLPERITSGLTPLLWVLSLNVHGKHEVAKILLENRADLNAADDCGRTAIFRAIVLGDDGTVDLLIKYRAYLSIPDQYGVRPIDIARYCVETGVMESATEILRKVEEVTGETDERDIEGYLSVRDLNPGVYYDWNSAERRYAECEYRRPFHGD